MRYCFICFAEEESSERFSKWSKATQIVYARTGMQTQVCSTPKVHVHSSLLCLNVEGRTRTFLVTYLTLDIKMLKTHQNTPELL